MTKLSIKQFIKHFINKYRQKRIDYQPKTFEKNNLTIAVNILYIKEKEISPVYISKTNSNFEKKIIIIIIITINQTKKKKAGIILK